MTWPRVLDFRHLSGQTLNLFGLERAFGAAILAALRIGTLPPTQDDLKKITCNLSQEIGTGRPEPEPKAKSNAGKSITIRFPYAQFPRVLARLAVLRPI